MSNHGIETPQPNASSAHVRAFPGLAKSVLSRDGFLILVAVLVCTALLSATASTGGGAARFLLTAALGYLIGMSLKVAHARRAARQ